jgi:predicted dienelactone hydrolase
MSTTANQRGPIRAGDHHPDRSSQHRTIASRPLGSVRHAAVAMVLALLASLLVLSGDALASPAAAATDDVPAPPFADAAIGDRAVGKTTVEVAVPHRDVPLPVELWYPADAAAAAAADDAVYTLTVPFGEASLTLTQPSPLAKDAPTVADDASFPLVVFSHGSGGVRFQSLFLAEALASHGYIVVAPDHVGNTFGDSSGTPVFDRPRDVSALIDAAVARQIAPDLLGEAVDITRVAVSGHSFGGYTAVAVAAGNPSIDFDPDPRVDAIVPIAPALGPSLLADEVLEDLSTPTLFLGGTADTVTPIEPNIDRAIGLMSADVVYRLDVEDAGHYSFTDVCDFADAIVDQTGGLADLILAILPGYPESCDGSLRAIGEVQELTILSTVGFLDEQLGDSVDPPPIDFSDVQPGNVHRDAILELAAEGILLGGDDGLFRPRGVVTRGQLASVAARVIGLDPVVPARFTDTAGSVHEGAIEALAIAGIVVGYPDGTFRPDEPVAREQIAAVLARWLEVGPVDTGPFTDVAGSPYRRQINALAELDVVRGTSATTFAPRGQLQRDQLASLIVRARPLAPTGLG